VCGADAIVGGATRGLAAGAIGEDCGEDSGRSSVACARSRGGSVGDEAAGGVSRGTTGVAAGAGGVGASERFIAADEGCDVSAVGIDWDTDAGAGVGLRCDSAAADGTGAAGVRASSRGGETGA
jgi:hypothetical protein